MNGLSSKRTCLEIFQVNDIYIFGIYPIYKNGDASIAQETEDAIVKICQQKYDDDAYLAAHALYYHISGSGPLFPMDKDRLQTAIRECIKRDEDKLKKCSKWVDTLHENIYQNLLYMFCMILMAQETCTISCNCRIVYTCRWGLTCLKRHV